MAFSGSGAGTLADPYQITTVAQLQEMKDYQSAHFKLMNDIDASATSGWNSGAGFLPVGSVGGFTGRLNGQGYEISGLYINSSELSVGMFGVVSSGAVISNVILTGATIVSTNAYASYTGGLVGLSNGATISNCGFSGEVSGAGPGTGYIGGFIGFAIGGTISGSYAKGTVGGCFYAGGFAGGVRGSYGEVRNCYSTVAVTGFISAGGFVNGMADSGCEIADCYAAGAVAGISTAGFVVDRWAGALITNCCIDIDITGATDVNVTEYSTSEMQALSSFTGLDWDIASAAAHVNEAWYVDEGSDYPRLLVEKTLHYLAVANCTHTHSADDLELSGIFSLSIADCAHEHSVGGLIMQMIHIVKAYLGAAWVPGRVKARVGGAWIYKSIKARLSGEWATR